MTAIYFRDQKISYNELLTRINSCKIENPIFPVTKTLDCVIKILHCLIYKVSFFPYSPLLATPPALTIPNECDFILHTSGSSRMKFALFNKNAFLEANQKTHPAFFLATGDVYLLNLPLYHVAGLSLLLRAFMRGASIAIDPSDLSLITHVSMVPAMTNTLFPHSPYPSLKALLLGGSAIPKELADKLISHGYPLYITYGMTEMSSHIFVERYSPEHSLSFTGPLPGRVVKIDESGTLYVKGCGKFIRYLKANKEAYHNTKDKVVLSRGRYVIKGRADKMFISGGENIYPEEIEKALLSHPLILKAHVEVKSHLKWGDRPFVRVTTKDGTLTYEEVEHFLSEKLERFKIPKAHEIALC